MPNVAVIASMINVWAFVRANIFNKILLLLWVMGNRLQGNGS